MSTQNRDLSRWLRFQTTRRAPGHTWWSGSLAIIESLRFYFISRVCCMVGCQYSEAGDVATILRNRRRERVALITKHGACAPRYKQVAPTELEFPRHVVSHLNESHAVLIAPRDSSVIQGGVRNDAERGKNQASRSKFSLIPAFSPKEKENCSCD